APRCLGLLLLDAEEDLGAVLGEAGRAELAQDHAGGKRRVLRGIVRDGLLAWRADVGPREQDVGALLLPGGLLAAEDGQVGEGIAPYELVVVLRGGVEWRGDAGGGVEQV